jgi:hypothetical protein
MREIEKLKFLEEMRGNSEFKHETNAFILANKKKHDQSVI